MFPGPKGYVWSTPTCSMETVKKMAVLHFFRVNSTQRYILFSLPKVFVLFSHRFYFIFIMPVILSWIFRTSTKSVQFYICYIIYMLYNIYAIKYIDAI